MKNIESIYRQMNRLKCKGMKGWSPSSKIRLEAELDGYNLDQVYLYLESLLNTEVHKLTLDKILREMRLDLNV